MLNSSLCFSLGTDTGRFLLSGKTSGLCLGFGCLCLGNGFSFHGVCFCLRFGLHGFGFFFLFILFGFCFSLALGKDCSRFLLYLIAFGVSLFVDLCF